VTAQRGWHYVLEDGEVHVFDVKAGSFVAAGQALHSGTGPYHPFNDATTRVPAGAVTRRRDVRRRFNGASMRDSRARDRGLSEHATGCGMRRCRPNGSVPHPHL
jgi:hypothetical protein